MLAAAHPLDGAPWGSLTGAHGRLAERVGQAARYPRDVCPLVALAPGAGIGAWADAAALVGPGGLVTTVAAQSDGPPLPPGWEVVRQGRAFQLVDGDLEARTDPEAVVLGPRDVPEMLDLVARTEPGPFLPRTIELGTHLGVRRQDRLVAMAGERLRPPGWTEISAVCTDADHRGRGLATRLVRAVAAGIRERDEVPFLHVAETNHDALRLYCSIGFEVRKEVDFAVIQVPPAPSRRRPRWNGVRRSAKQRVGA